MALVRLGWAAQNSLPDSPGLASAVASLATGHPEAVLKSIAKWFDDDDRLTAGVNVFLALASTRAGLYCCADVHATISGAGRRRLDA
jgi:hypothetical protein